MDENLGIDHDGIPWKNVNVNETDDLEQQSETEAPSSSNVIRPRLFVIVSSSDQGTKPTALPQLRPFLPEILGIAPNMPIAVDRS
jgi:hypothetical protein